MTFCKCGNPFCENNPVDLLEANEEFERLNKKYIIDRVPMTPDQLEHQLAILRAIGVCILGSQIASYAMNNFPDPQEREQKSLELLAEITGAVYGAAQDLMKNHQRHGSFLVPFAEKEMQT